MRFALILGVLVAAAGCDSHAGHSHGTPTPAATGSVDPVCGMTVDPAKAAAKIAVDGKDVLFCSPNCKATYEKEPDRYAMGYCACAKTMPDCTCGHCKALAAKTKPTSACPCKDEKKGGDHGDHKH